MKDSFHQTGQFPTEAHTVLLKAALLSGQSSQDAWDRWVATTNLDTVDHATVTLLPLLYKNMSRQGVTGPLMQTLKGIYRYRWTRNMAILQELAGRLRALDEAGIETLVLKEAALALLVYRDAGLRAVESGDILIHRGDIIRTLELLGDMGFKHAAVPRTRLPLLHGLRVHHPASGHHITVHWYAMEEAGVGRDDGSFWNAAVPFTVHGLATRTLDPADHLLHTLMQGMRGGQEESLGRIADAVTIVQTYPLLDWDRLATRAVAYNLTLRVSRTLCYLYREFGVPVPPAVLRSLRSAQVSLSERLELRANSREGSLIAPWRAHVLRYARNTTGQSLSARLAGLPGYMHDWTGTTHAWQLIVPVARTLRHPSTD